MPDVAAARLTLRVRRAWPLAVVRWLCTVALVRWPGLAYRLGETLGEWTKGLVIIECRRGHSWERIREAD